MESISYGEAAERFGELIGKAEAGETITITRDGEPVAALVPTSAAADTAQPASPPKHIDVSALRALTAKMAPATRSAVEIVREMRDSRY